MKKGKILSALLACSMSVVAASACAFTVGCKDKGGNEGDGDNTGHQHTWATTWSHDDTNHWHACTADGHTGAHKDVAKHVYDNDQDTTCNTCDYVRTISGGGNEEENPNPPSTVKETVVWSVDDNFKAQTVGETEVELKAGMGVYAGKDVIFEASKGKKLTYKGTEVGETTNRVKFNGDGDATKKYLHVKVEADATVIVYAWSGTGGAPAYLKMLSADGQVAVKSQQVSDGTNSVAWATMFEVKANTDYYIVSDSTAATGAKNAIFNYVAVDYDFKETFTPVEAKEPECEVDGNIAHSVSDYGRYKNENGEFISRNSVVRAKLNHSYSLKTGSINNPTATAPGSATLTCANGHDTDVALPVLSSDKYTARPAAGQTGTYTITVEGVAISFEATGVAVTETTYTDVYKLENFAAVTVGNSKTEGQNCVYATSGTATLNTADGSLRCGEATGGATTQAYVSLGTPISSGVVKITGTLTVESNNGKWTFFQILNSENKEFIGFRTASGGAWGYRGAGANEPSTTPIAYSNTTTHTFEILIDFDSLKVTVKVDSTVLADDVALSNKADATVTDFSSIMINCNAGRYVRLGSVTIATQD